MESTATVAQSDVDESKWVPHYVSEGKKIKLAKYAKYALWAIAVILAVIAAVLYVVWSKKDGLEKIFSAVSTIKNLKGLIISATVFACLAEIAGIVSVIFFRDKLNKKVVVEKYDVREYLKNKSFNFFDEKNFSADERLAANAYVTGAYWKEFPGKKMTDLILSAVYICVVITAYILIALFLVNELTQVMDVNFEQKNSNLNIGFGVVGLALSMVGEWIYLFVVMRKFNVWKFKYLSENDN